jgi:hypothetical protein
VEVNVVISEIKIYILFIAIIFFSTKVYATSIETDSLESAIQKSTEIAIVKIIKITPAHFKFDGKMYSCGSYYSVIALESFKGKRKKFDFFTRNDRFFAGFEPSYFLVVYGQDKSDLISSGPVRTFSDAENLCISRSLETYAPSTQQTVIPFEQESAKENELWLRPSPQYAFGSIIADEKYTRKKIEDGTTCGFANIAFLWKEIESDVKRELSRLRLQTQ